MIKFLKESEDSTLYEQLVKFQNGEISAREIHDELITKVNSLGGVIIDFGGLEEFLEIFDIPEHDKYMLRYAESSYRNYEYVDWYRAEDEWHEGYMLGWLNAENQDKVKELLRILSPNLIDDINGFSDNEDDRKKIANLLYETFQRDCDDIINEYIDIGNKLSNDFIVEFAKEHVCNALTEYDIELVGYCYHKYYTTVSNLISLFEKYDVKDSNLKGLLLSISPGESMYDILDALNDEFYTFNIDINDEATKRLDDMLEHLEDTDYFTDVEGYKEMVGIITKKYEFNHWYKVPKYKAVHFNIVRINPETNLIELKLKNLANMNQVKYQVNFEQLNLILYHPELFNIHF